MVDMFWPEGSIIDQSSNIRVITWERGGYILAWGVKYQWMQQHTCCYMRKEAGIFWPEGSNISGFNNIHRKRNGYILTSGVKYQRIQQYTYYCMGKGAIYSGLRASNIGGSNHIRVITWEKEWIYSGLKGLSLMDPVTYWSDVYRRWIPQHTFYYIGKGKDIF